MTAIYITLAVLAYLLIGSVVVGLLIRLEPSMAETELYTPFLTWPLVLVALVFYLPAKAGLYLAKRIGGVK